MLVGREHHFNSLAQSAALVSDLNCTSFVAAAPLDALNGGIAIGLGLEATGRGISGILDGVAATLSEAKEDSGPTTLGLWGGIEFERLAYVYSHWSPSRAQGSLYLLRDTPMGKVYIEVSARARHPTLGAGLLCLLVLKNVVLESARQAEWINALNDSELDSTDRPFFGAWCVDGPTGHPTFVTFLENNDGPRNYEADYLFGAMLMRADDIREIISLAKSRLHRHQLTP